MKEKEKKKDKKRENGKIGNLLVNEVNVINKGIEVLLAFLVSEANVVRNMGHW